MNNIIDELKWRDILKQITNEEKVLSAQENYSGVYCGFDPTADSLHVGHLVLIISLKRFQDFGFKSIALIGGGTGMIGDPSFKAGERQLLTVEKVDENVFAIKKQLEKIIPEIEIVNNANWIRNLSLVDFLRFVGKDFNLSYLLNKDSIASRIEKGLSITEFSYTMLQAYDFYQLYEKNNCLIQIGGSDQWGNITSGTDYISSKIGKENSKAAGITMKLLTKKDGIKFGKTETGTVWLDSKKTSEYEFFQFFINQDDEDCENLLKFLTFLSKNEIYNILEQHKKEPSKRIMQNRLAEEVVKFVHGQVGLEKAKKITSAFFENNITKLSELDLKSALTGITTVFSEEGLNLVDFLVKNKLATSNREAREFISSGAIYLNDQKMSDEKTIIDKNMAIYNNIVLIRRGKKKYSAVIFK